MRYSPTTSNLRILEEEFLGSEYKIYVWPQEHLHTKEEGHDWKVVPLYFGVSVFGTNNTRQHFPRLLFKMNMREWTDFKPRTSLSGRFSRVGAPSDAPHAASRLLVLARSLVLCLSISRSRSLARSLASRARIWRATRAARWSTFATRRASSRRGTDTNCAP